MLRPPIQLRGRPGVIITSPPVEVELALHAAIHGGAHDRRGRATTRLLSGLMAGSRSSSRRSTLVIVDRQDLVIGTEIRFKTSNISLDIAQANAQPLPHIGGTGDELSD